MKRYFKRQILPFSEINKKKIILYQLYYEIRKQCDIPEALFKNVESLGPDWTLIIYDS